MKIKEIKTIIVEFSEDEREILSKAEEILLNLSLKTDEFDEIPMNEEDFDLLNDIWEHSNDVQTKLYCKEK